MQWRVGFSVDSLVAAIGCLFAHAAMAQAWTERPYSPQAGSRWLIVAQTDAEDFRGAEHRTQQIKFDRRTNR